MFVDKMSTRPRPEKCSVAWVATVKCSAQSRSFQGRTENDINSGAVAGAECNTVIELKQAQHDAFPPLLS